MVMKVLVITGSPHRKGTSALMAEKFIEGASEMGAQINRFDAAFANVHPCIGCDVCHCGENKCVFDDDMMSLYPKIQDADIIVYISPLYYHNISAQMKAVIDRYHGIDDLIRHKPKKVLSIITAAYPEDWVFDGVKAVIKTTTRYLGWGNKVLYGKEPTKCLYCRNCMWYIDGEKCPVVKKRRKVEKI